jgi:glycerol-3-phosphate dehydrogenase (NAD(P)+)
VNRLTVVGGGSWGTALTIALASRFERISLWIREPDLAAETAATRENRRFLPGFSLPENAAPTPVIEDGDLVLGVVPSQFARAVYETARFSPGVPIVSATKGLERVSLKRMSEVIAETQPGRPVAVLSGPTFAREVARGDPAALVVAAADPELALCLQKALSTPRFRLYTNTDVIGVEIGASLKNVVAIAAGIVQGLGLGSNTMAALITRGLAEMTRVAAAAGGDPRTLAGLAGMGDLVLTCSGDLSRNRQVGLRLADGNSLAEAVAGMNMVAEGVATTAAAVELAARLGVDVPICHQLLAILEGRQTPREAIRDLMERSPRGE